MSTQFLRTMMRRSGLPLLALAVISASCSVSSAPEPSGNILRAEYLLTTAAGGQVSEIKVVVDFTTETYAVTLCDQRQNAPCATAGPPPRAMDSAVQARLRDQMQSVSFRRLRGSYGLSITPPDPSSGRLIVTTSLGEQIVSWDRRATRPEILVDVECRLLQLAGWLILCA